MNENSETNSLILKQTKTYYGSGDKNVIINSPLKVIYCVHGKPSAGCCTVTGKFVEGEDSTSNSCQTIDNIQTADMINEHCHRQLNIGVDKKARRKLITASILCVIFMIGEIIGGYMSSSLAIATDAAHLLTDFASFMISLFSLWVGSRPATQRMSFGWYRAEVIGALTSVLMIWVVTGILLYLAIERILTKSFEIESEIMVITSGVGVIVNLIMGLTLHQHGHSHGGSSHGKQSKNQLNNNDVESQLKRKVENINVRAAYIHVIGDFIQSFGVLIAAIIIYYKPEWNIVDPICTFLFSILVLFTTFAIIKDTLLVLMEGMPKGIDFTEVMNTFLNINGVVKVHNLRIWALSLDKTAISAHLAIVPGASPQSILMIATGSIHDKYNFFEMTLQIEEFDENMEDCKQCELPSN